jgi:antirestriction protein ArdC
MRSSPSRPAGTKAPHRKRATAAAASDHVNLYDEVTRRIIAELEAGRLPWVQPWGQAGGSHTGLPRNALSGRSYSGVNILLLWGAVIAHGYPTQGWLTFRQAFEAGGCVRKGERGTMIVHADRFIPEAEKARLRGAREGEGKGEGDRATLPGDDAHAPRSVPFLKRFTVFNVAQSDGLRAGLGGDLPPLPECEIVPVAEHLIAASGVDVRIGGARAFYAPALDFVQVPPQPAFFHQIDYYRTCLHELTHATGHASRLGRDLGGGFGSKAYAREELVAELGSAFLCAALGIVPTVRHADYVGSWLEVLREDNRAIFRAASAASKAADWLLARDAAAAARRWSAQ